MSHQKILRSLLLCCSLVLGASVLSAHSAAAIGISPPLVQIDSVLRGSSQTKTIDVSKEASQLNEDVAYTVSVRTPYENAVEAPEGFVIPAGESHYSYTFKINSAQAANGDYEAIFVFTETPVNAETEATDAQTSAVSRVVEGAAAVVKFGIGGSEIVSYQVTDLSAASIEEDDQLLMEYTINNDGNVSWRPDQIKLVFTDRQDSAKTFVAEIAGDTLEYSEPGTNDQLSFIAPVELAQGSYIAVATFIYKDQAVATLTSQPFDVFPANTLAQTGQVVSVKANKAEYQLNENIKVDVEFENTGDTRITGILLADIYKDDSLVDYLRGEELVVDAGETTTFSHFFQFAEAGNYRIELSVEYANKKTEAVSTTFTVLKPDTFLTPLMISIIAIVIVSVIAIIIVMMVVRKKRKLSSNTITN